MKNLLIAIAVLSMGLFSVPAKAQVATTVATCGGQTMTAGVVNANLNQTVQGVLCMAPGPVGSTTDRSITITTGGTAQLVMAANTARRSFYVWNPNASGTCWASFTTTTPAANALGSFPVPSLGAFGIEVSPPGNALYINCPTTSQVVTAWESQ